nr:HNH endonuclease signature motif containing protein [Halorhodospira halophila]
MAFVRGNKAVRDHAQKGKELLLFETLEKEKSVRFQGTFSCASWELRQGKDRDGNDRQIIVFHLVPQELTTSADVGDEAADYDDLESLRRAAYEASQQTAASSSKKTREEYRRRSAAVKSYVLARAEGICEGCNSSAPFQRANGSPYLEPHHILRLADEGPDDPRYVAALCPNCHRRCHHGDDGAQFNERLLAHIQEIEKQELFESASSVR